MLSLAENKSKNIERENKILKELIGFVFADRYRHSLRLQTVLPDDSVKFRKEEKSQCVFYENRGNHNNDLISREYGDPIEAHFIESKEITISDPTIYTLDDFEDELERKLNEEKMNGIDFDEDDMMRQCIFKEIDEKVNDKVKQLSLIPVSNLKKFIEKELNTMHTVT